MFLDFADAADSLAGAFSFHGEARKNRVGFFADINFIRLSTDASVTTPVLSRQINGTAQLDMTMFEAGGSYLVQPQKELQRDRRCSHLLALAESRVRKQRRGTDRDRYGQDRGEHLRRRHLPAEARREVDAP